MEKYLRPVDIGESWGRANRDFFQHGEICRARDVLYELKWLEPRLPLRAILYACDSAVFPEVRVTGTYTYPLGPDHVAQADVGLGFASVDRGRQFVALRSRQLLACQTPHFGQRVKLFALLIRIGLVLSVLLAPPRRNLALSAVSARLLGNSVVLCERYILEYFKQERELCISLVHLLLRFLSSLRQLRNVTLVGHAFFEEHGFGRPPRAMAWALAGSLSQ